MDTETATKQLTASLYEVIAYFGSACLALLLFATGLLDRSTAAALQASLGALNTPEKVLLVVAAGTVTYVYGQLASALSSTIIGSTVSGFANRYPNRLSGDFNFNFSNIVEQCGLTDGLPASKHNSKWTIIYFIISAAPYLGRDVLNRQARERLARINATNMLFLATLSLLGLLLNAIGFRPPEDILSLVRVPSLTFALVCIALGIVFTYEFYKRKCWNNDIIVKILPAVRRVYLDHSLERRSALNGT